jgi:hypothetical protein
VLTSNDKEVHLEPLLRERDAAAILGVSVAWLRRCRWAGTGPTYIKLTGKLNGNGRVRYAPAAIREFIIKCGCNTE